jgi:hypothetical protein
MRLGGEDGGGTWQGHPLRGKRAPRLSAMFYAMLVNIQGDTGRSEAQQTSVLLAR